MRNRAGRSRGFKVGLIAAIAAVACLAFAAVALANNLDRRTATNVAKQVAKKECQQTSGCQDFFVRRLHRVSSHKALGKIAVVANKHGEQFVCVRQIVIKLDAFTGQITYGTSARRCTDTGPAKA
jgi:hypothetical protein